MIDVTGLPGKPAAGRSTTPVYLVNHVDENGVGIHETDWPHAEKRERVGTSGLIVNALSVLFQSVRMPE